MDIRLLLDAAHPQKLLRRCLRFPQYLKYCYSERGLIQEVKKEEGLVRHVLGDRDLVCKLLQDKDYAKTALEQKAFVQNCLGKKPMLEPFLYSRHLLSKMNVDEGTLYIDGERELLQEAVRQADALPGPIIEIGTLWGYTTALMAQWKSPEKKIITVDNYCWNPWGLSPDSHKIFTHRFLGYLISRGEVNMVDSDKTAFYNGYRGPSPSLVFLDADHTYEETRKDIEWARRQGAKIIAGHDYCDAFGVKRAVDEAGGRCAAGGSVWVLKGSDWKPEAEFTLRQAA